MKRKTIFIIFAFLAVIAIIILAFKTSNTIQFFRRIESFSVDEVDEMAVNETGILLYDNIDLHNELIDNKDSFRIVKNHFSEPWEKTLDESDLRHIYTDSFENDDFDISFAMIEQKSEPSKRFKFVWEISPKKKNTSLSQYDFQVSSQGSLHWELENNQNNMLIRYSKKDSVKWLKMPLEAGGMIFSNDFPGYYWNKYLPSFNMRPDLVQLWCEGFYSFYGTDTNTLLNVSLHITKKGLSKEVIEYPISWWSEYLY